MLWALGGRAQCVGLTLRPEPQARRQRGAGRRAFPQNDEGSFDL